ncbi:hypothetical protein [Sphingobium sp. KCTC 72723]|uniref:hypothetical protein n=1 Tax=Sphingobium sp. KCTC 72723 TaxID=2733867 RepID=UPI00165D3496|nr:hypothetical protein [Sphingobium sp. KCTC 72723]
MMDNFTQDILLAGQIDILLQPHRITKKAQEVISSEFMNAWHKLEAIFLKQGGFHVTVRQDSLTPSIFVISLADESKDLFMNFWEAMANHTLDMSKFGKSDTRKQMQRGMYALGCWWSELVFEACAVKQWADKNRYSYEALTADGWVVGRIRFDNPKAITYAKTAGQFRAEWEAA